MRALIAGIVGLIAIAVVVWIFDHDSTAGQGIALAFVGVACVFGVSAVFWVVGRSEDEERRAAAAAKPPPPARSDEDQPPADPHPRPALDRRRPMPPRRPR
jgi:hypothetical protein